MFLQGLLYDFGSMKRVVAVGSCMLVGLPALYSEVLDLEDFGLGDLSPGADVTPVFRRAIEACGERGASGLRIPPGEWHVFPDWAFERHLGVANNNSGVKRVVLLLDDLKDFVVEAEGAALICHGEMIPISAENTYGLTIRGLSIDWDQPFHFQGEVVAVDSDAMSFDLKVHPETIYEIRGERLIFRGKKNPTPNFWREWAPPTGEMMTWEHNLQWNMWFEGDSRRPVPGEHILALEPDPRVEELKPGLIRIHKGIQVLPAPGMVLTVKGMMTPNRTSPAIRAARCSDLLLEDVSIHHAGGMGLIVQRTDGITLRKFRVTLPEGKGRMVSTTADATHFNGCKGRILIEDCEFENMLDDATNVHGCFVRVEKQIGPKRLVCRRVHSQQRKLIVMEEGDRVRFVTTSAIQPYGDASVTGTRELNSDLFEVELDEIPGGELRKDSGLYNLTWQPDLTFRNSVVRNNRARTMLIATAGKVVIEDNRFEYSSMAGIQFEGDNGFWWESGPSRDVIIRRNRFVNNAGSVLRIMPQIDAMKHPKALYHGGILFENNEIETFHRLLVEAVAVDGLTLRGNTVRMIDYRPSYDPGVAVRIDSGRDVVLEGNHFKGDEPLRVRGGTPSAVPQMRGNEGFVLRE